MPKINKKEEVEKQEINLSFDEVKQIAAEYEELGKEAFLVKRQAIRVNEDGNWHIMHYEGLANARIKAYRGFYYESDIPFDFWNKVLVQVDYYVYKRNLKYKEQQEIIKQQNESGLV